MKGKNMKQKSSHAQAAAWIRTELKKAYPGMKFTCTSESFSMGNAVRVEIFDQPPAVKEAVEAIVKKYQYGHFDGMNDIYEYSNSRKDLPQVKYVQLSNTMSDEKAQEIYSKLRATWGGGDELPERYADARNAQLQGEYVSQLVWRGFTGAIQL